MLKSRIRVDLPSAETERKMGPLERLRSSFGAQIDLKSGEEELTVSALTLTRSLVDGFRQAGVTNAIAFLVDKKVVYKDVNDEEDDLGLILEAADQSGVLNKPFQEMHMVLTHSEGGIHYLFDVRIQDRVMLGDEEMAVEVSGRVEELRIRVGETAAKYAKRVKAFGAKRSHAQDHRRAFDAQVERISQALEAALTGSRVSVDSGRIELIRPAAHQLAEFKKLKFGDDVTPPTYRAVPSQQRAGAYSDPFYYYYYDPYYDLTHLYLLDSLHHHDAWRRSDVIVVDPGGDPLFVADQAANHEAEFSSISSDAVSFTDEGGLVVADEITSSDWGVGEVGDAGDSGGGFFSNLFGGGDSGSSSFSDLFGDSGSSDASSCGSSCSGASCGSSCGGCGGCGGCG